MTSFQDSVLEHLAAFNAAPFLFIGAGLPRRYLNLDSWEGLLKRYADQSNINFDYLSASSSEDLPTVASMLAEHYHPFWWNDPQFSENRELYKKHSKKSKESALKIEISHFESNASISNVTDDLLKKELDFLSKAVIDGIITTNYDRLLEELFPDYKVYIGQDQLIFSDSYKVGEIYKIHGCCTLPNSLVLTKDDYKTFEERNAYLIAKLLTVFTEHPIIFLGYRLGDNNIRNIVASIASCLTSDNIDKLGDRLILVQWDRQGNESTFHRASIVLGSFSVPIIQIKVNNFLELFEALSTMKRKFPAQLLRTLKKHVYELVLSTEISEKLYVQNLEADIDTSDIDVVFGVGLHNQLQKTGYKGLNRDDLVEDLLGIIPKGKRPPSPKEVVTDVLPDIVKRAKLFPAFKFLRSAGYLNNDGTLKKATPSQKLNKIISERNIAEFYPSPFYTSKRHVLDDSIDGFKKFINSNSIKDILIYITLFKEDSYDLDLMKDFLSKNYAVRKESANETSYYRAVCLYDFLKFRAL